MKGKIRTLYDDDGNIVARAYPGEPVSIAGYKGELPPTGAGEWKSIYYLSNL